MSEAAASGWRRAASRPRKLVFAVGSVALLASLVAGFVHGFSLSGRPPFGALAYGRVARAHYAARDYEAAALEYLGEQRINQVHELASVRLADALRRIGRTEDALEALRVGAGRSLDPAMHVRYAHALAEAGRYAEAEQAIRRAVGLDPGNPRLLQRLGSFLASRGSFAAAADAFERALRLDPTSIETRQALERARRRASDLETAPSPGAARPEER
jgi:tetratricopeptide (TPR) repeat protein